MTTLEYVAYSIVGHWVVWEREEETFVYMCRFVSDCVECVCVCGCVECVTNKLVHLLGCRLLLITLRRSSGRSVSGTRIHGLLSWARIICLGTRRKRIHQFLFLSLFPSTIVSFNSASWALASATAAAAAAARWVVNSIFIALSRVQDRSLGATYLLVREGCCCSQRQCVILITIASCCKRPA